MQKPGIPDNEEARLKALHAINILDTEPEERFDRLTRLAKRLFNVPIALVSLIDRDRQWFKSRLDFAAEETSREVSFCAHAILQDDILVVPDAIKDARFSGNPAVTGDGLRFYAGCPLILAPGIRVGTLCLVDTQPRDMAQEDLELLADLGRMAQQELAAMQMATLDELTGLSNRRGFNILADYAINVCRRNGQSACLLYIDLDGFKAINDNCGHAAGDRALVDFSDLLRDEFRGSDMIGRLGGDEFGVLLSDSTLRGVAPAVERFNEAVEAFNQTGRRAYRLACSIGAMELEHHHAGIADLMAEADQRMYEKKRGKAR